MPAAIRLTSFRLCGRTKNKSTRYASETSNPNSVRRKIKSFEIHCTNLCVGEGKRKPVSQVAAGDSETWHAPNHKHALCQKEDLPPEAL